MILPTKGRTDILKFDDFDKTLKLPYTIKLDFESDLVPLPQEEQRAGASTERLNKHVANSYCFKTIGPDGECVEEHSVFYRGPNAAKHCLEELTRVADALKVKLQAFRERPPLSPEDDAAWFAADVCHCGMHHVGDLAAPGKAPLLENNRKVRDHCHVTGEYRGAAHSNLCKAVMRRIFPKAT